MGENEAMTEFCPLPSGRELIADATEWKEFLGELRRQWRLLWRERIDDKMRAEGIASKDFELLFIDLGTVIIATRRYRQLDFKEILEQYEAPYEIKIKQETPLPHIGGWRKFGKEIAASQRKTRRNRRRRTIPTDGVKCQRKSSLQLKHGGRGWLHIKTK